MNDFEAIMEALDRIGCSITVNETKTEIETYCGFYSWYKFDNNGWLIDAKTYSAD